MRKSAVIATSAAALTVAGALIPTQANAAKVKFGAELTPDVQPSNSLPAYACDWIDPTVQCSFVQNEAYGRPDTGEKAPLNGTLKKVRVIAGGSGSFTLQLVKVKEVGGVLQTKVKATGPTLDYDGQSFLNWDSGVYNVEVFRVNMPIKSGWSLAMKSTDNSAIRCSGGGANTFIHYPALTPGWDFVAPDASDGCYTLVEGVIKY